MWDLLERVLCSHGHYRRRVEQSLKLEQRGGVKGDGLSLADLQHRMEVRWHARKVHPWDRHLPSEERRARFIEQALTDTETAIARLFESVPEVDLIDMKVMEPETDSILLSGEVSRYDFEHVRPSPSVRMRLTEIGVSFESLEMDYGYQLRV
jgi:hypothetical protein